MFSVHIIELSHSPGDDEDRTSLAFHGFETAQQAQEFARRWLRDSLEELRRPNQSAAALRQAFFLFGESADVPEIGYSAISELDTFIQHPATPDERNWKALRPPQ